ncbi:uncharacterized protein LOC131681362 [Topomyia yanbarensis]|uniref:uncharacterized protein LOC131681362 n=1 Tax=Topomyia yanbarensis TaxID=2498891 RepID=UPI00273C90E0|nr:uncharacterized protein LOC131681362 [Topomyia yanbarensis]
MRTMKFLHAVCGLLLLVSIVQCRPCEDCDEEVPLAASKLDDPDIISGEDLLRNAVPTVEDGTIPLPDNVIDAPVVCPPGQKPDHKGKCREVWSRKSPA